MQKIKAQPAVRDATRGSINARDFLGAALNKPASQSKALLLRLNKNQKPSEEEAAAAPANNNTATAWPHGRTCALFLSRVRRLDTTTDTGNSENRTIATTNTKQCYCPSKLKCHNRQRTTQWCQSARHNYCKRSCRSNRRSIQSTCARKTCRASQSS
jgi:hypothetical protein